MLLGYGEERLRVSIYRIVQIVHFCFFFQAEDGIRDLYVTGVQTCALPIWARLLRASTPVAPTTAAIAPNAPIGASHRSEERRVGKESGSTINTPCLSKQVFFLQLYSWIIFSELFKIMPMRCCRRTIENTTF